MSVIEWLTALEQSLGLDVHHASFAPLFAGFLFASYRATQSNAPTFATVRFQRFPTPTETVSKLEIPFVVSSLICCFVFLTK
jgi:hypothetical protein